LRFTYPYQKLLPQKSREKTAKGREKTIIFASKVGRNCLKSREKIPRVDIGK
jgi:hypothetical protein